MDCPAWEKPGSMHCLSELIKNLKTYIFPTRARKILFVKRTFLNDYSKEQLKTTTENAIFFNDVSVDKDVTEELNFFVCL